MDFRIRRAVEAIALVALAISLSAGTCGPENLAAAPFCMEEVCRTRGAVCGDIIVDNATCSCVDRCADEQSCDAATNKCVTPGSSGGNDSGVKDAGSADANDSSAPRDGGSGDSGGD